MTSVPMPPSVKISNHQTNAAKGGIDGRTSAMQLSPKMHRLREIQSLQMHRRIASLMEHDPEIVIGKARHNLQAWAARREGAATKAALQEWMDLLERLSPEEVASFLVSESECATRMRQNSPFAGVLSPQEVWAIKRGHEAA